MQQTSTPQNATMWCYGINILSVTMSRETTVRLSWGSIKWYRIVRLYVLLIQRPVSNCSLTVSFLWKGDQAKKIFTKKSYFGQINKISFAREMAFIMPSLVDFSQVFHSAPKSKNSFAVEIKFKKTYFFLYISLNICVVYFTGLFLHFWLVLSTLFLSIW